MSDIKLFRTTAGSVTELSGSAVSVEKELQSLLEANLEEFLGIRYLDTEYSTGRTHRGRIDTLGIDENGCPVIIEYKRSRDENVINQGLFYLDWLLDHRAEFTMLAMKKFGPAIEDTIDWSSPRLLCIAADYTRYDEHAVSQINRNIELIRYRRYGSEFLLLELADATTATASAVGEPGSRSTTTKTVTDYLGQADPQLRELFDDLDAACSGFGDDVQRKTLKHYLAYKRIKNFACVEVHPSSNEILVYVKVDPDTVTLEDGFSRDVRNIGHFGTGDLELRVRNHHDLERALPHLQHSYEDS